MYLDKNIKIINNEKEFSFFDNKRKSFNCYPINFGSFAGEVIILTDLVLAPADLGLFCESKGF